MGIGIKRKIIPLEVPKKVDDDILVEVRIDYISRIEELILRETI